MLPKAKPDSANQLDIKVNSENTLQQVDIKENKETSEIEILREENKRLRDILPTLISSLEDILAKAKQLISSETVRASTLPQPQLIQTVPLPSEKPPAYEHGDGDALDFIAQAVYFTPGTKILKIGKEDGSVDALTLLPNGRVASAHHCTVKIWDLQTGKLLLSRNLPDRISSLESLPNNQLACGTYYTIYILDLLTGNNRPPLGGENNKIMGNSVHHLKSFPDGRLASAIYGRNTIWIWDLETRECLQVLNNENTGYAFDTGIICLALSSDGALLISGSKISGSKDGGSMEGVFKLWNSKTYECIRTLQITIPQAKRGSYNTVCCAQLLPNDALAIGLFDGGTRIYGTQTNIPILILEDTAPVRCLLPFNDKLASAAQDGSVKLWDTNTGECLKTLKEGIIQLNDFYADYPQCLQFMPGGVLLVDPRKEVEKNDGITVDILAFDLKDQKEKEQRENAVMNATGNVIVSASASTTNGQPSPSFTPLRQARDANDITITTVSASAASNGETSTQPKSSLPRNGERGG